MDFIGVRSVIIVVFASIVGLLLAGTEILLSAYIVKLLTLIGVGQPDNGLLQVLLGFFDDPILLLLSFVVATMFRSILHIVKGYCAVSANELFVTRLRLVCVSSTLAKNGINQNPSRVYSLISDVFLKSSQTFYGLAHSVPLIVQALFLLVFLLSLSLYLSMIGLIFTGFSGVLVFFVQRRIALIVRPLSSINDALYQNLKRILDNLLLIRFCKLENLENNQVISLLVNYLKRIRKSTLLGLFSENIPALLGSIVIAVLFLMQLREPDVSPELFIAFIYVFVRFVQSVSQIVSFSSLAIINFPYFMAAYRYYEELPINEISGFDAVLLGKTTFKVENGIEKEAVSLGRYDLTEAPSIKVDDISYHFDANKTIFENLSFTVPSGAQCVIIGPSGVGKSTLLNILVGELQPNFGQVAINNDSPCKFLDNYSHEAAYAGPEPLLFEGGIRDNLLYGIDRSVGDNEIIRILNILGLDEWLTQFGGNLNLPLGKQGTSISSGQAQRLSIARALLRRPKLLILDEVTANLDLASERSILFLLDQLKGDTTTVIVTHSAEMMESADIIIDLGEKRVKVTGSTL